MQNLRLSCAVLLAAGIAACGKAAERADTSRGMAGMTGMGGMGGMAGMMDTAMMSQMQSHMAMMGPMSADSMRAMLPMHRQMVANALSKMNADMQQMNMSPDAAWTALTDSIRVDLTRMPDMTGVQLKGAMPVHMARVMRLVEMHRRMMGPR